MSLHEIASTACCQPCLPNADDLKHTHKEKHYRPPCNLFIVYISRHSTFVFCFMPADDRDRSAHVKLHAAARLAHRRRRR